MNSLVAAYLGGWCAVAIYSGWLAMQNARLARRLDELEATLKEKSGREVGSRAA